MVLAVHAQLGGAAAGGYGNGLVCAGSHEGCGLYHGVRRCGAEAAAVGTGGVVETGYLSRRLCEVAAAALVHIAAGLLSAVDYILYILFCYTGVLYCGKKRQNAGSLIRDVLMHYMGGEVNVYIVGTVYAAYQLVVMIQALGMLLGYQALHFRQLYAVGYAGHDGFVNEGVFRKLRLVLRYEILFQLDQVKHVAGLHEKEELFLGHHLAELAEAAVAGACLVAPGLGYFRQLIGGNVADVDLIGIVGKHVLKAPYMAGQLLEVFAFGVHYALGGLGGAVMNDHIRSMYQNIACSFDYAFHLFAPLFYLLNETAMPLIYTM